MNDNEKIPMDSLKNVLAVPNRHVLLPERECSPDEYFIEVIANGARSIAIALKQQAMHIKPRNNVKVSVNGFQDMNHCYFVAEISAKMIEKFEPLELAKIYLCHGITHPADINKYGIYSNEDQIILRGKIIVDELLENIKLVGDKVAEAQKVNATYLPPTTIITSDLFKVINTNHLIQISVGMIIETGHKLPEDLAFEFVRIKSAAITEQKIK